MFYKYFDQTLFKWQTIFLQSEHTENEYQGEADFSVFHYFNFLPERHERQWTAPWWRRGIYSDIYNFSAVWDILLKLYRSMQRTLMFYLWKYEPRRQKTGLRGFRPGPLQIRLYSHRRWLETGNFGFRKQRDCTIQVAKTKALISFAVTAKLICVFVFAYAKIRFSDVAAHMTKIKCLDRCKVIGKITRIFWSSHIIVEETS